MAQRAHMAFLVKESSDGTPWIMMAPHWESLTPLRDGFIGFDLKPGTTREQAEELAQDLNELVEMVSYTRGDDDVANGI